jgi:hypothetical protein
MSASGNSSIKLERATDEVSGDADRCTPGGAFVISGVGFGEHRFVPENIGVYLHGPPGTPLIRVMRYTMWKDTEIRGIWPREVAGPQTLFVEVTDGSLVRGVFYRVQIVPHAAVPHDATGSNRCGSGSAAGVFGGESQRRAGSAEGNRHSAAGTRITERGRRAAFCQLRFYM